MPTTTNIRKGNESTHDYLESIQCFYEDSFYDSTHLQKDMLNAIQSARIHL